MTGRLVACQGFWAVQFEGAARPVFTSFKATVPAEKALRAVRRDFPGDTIEAPQSPGWLFEIEELRECEMSACPLFSEVLP